MLDAYYNIFIPMCKDFTGADGVLAHGDEYIRASLSQDKTHLDNFIHTARGGHMSIEESDLPFINEPTDPEKALLQEQFLEEHFDDWLLSLPH